MISANLKYHSLLEAKSFPGDTPSESERDRALSQSLDVGTNNNGLSKIFHSHSRLLYDLSTEPALIERQEKRSEII